MDANDTATDEGPSDSTIADQVVLNERLAEMAKALGHPARVAIMRLLLSLDGCFVGQIVDELPLAQSTVSQHLRKLKDAGLIKGDIDGPRTCYCPNPAGVVELHALMSELIVAGPNR